jgi:formamidopyrimidine-DNA glycosylase
MPELPEVETIKSQLSKALPFTVTSVEESPVISSLTGKSKRYFSPKGMSLVKIERKGKLMDFHFVDDKGHESITLLCHLGMSGGWRISKKKVLEKHTHLQIGGHNLDGSLFMAYVDPRRFGVLKFADELTAQQELAKLGVDIASDDFHAEYVWQTLKRYPERQLKVFLLDQKFFAGSGNYIANEICARAGIRPTRKASKVTRKECDKIVLGTRQLLEGSLKNNGVAFSGGYTDTTGSLGDGLTDLVVFWQKICGLCHVTPVKKIILAQRGTFYCPKCQK